MKIAHAFHLSFILLIFSTGIYGEPASTTAQCKTSDVPKVIRMINDWDIIANNVATIPTAFAFSGQSLSFALSAKPKNPKNIVMLDKTTGEVTVKAVTKDDFDITMTAKNNCGTANATFNVWIDEEE